MKTPPNQTAFESAPDKRDYNPGTLLKRINTVRASVLSSLLQGQPLTGLDSVYEEATTRLSAVIFVLENDYGWHIERRDIAVGTSDGRIAMITAYWLPQAIIAQAFASGARDWVDKVKAARVERRKQAAKCKSDAAKINARRYFKAQDPRQVSLWGS